MKRYVVAFSTALPRFVCLAFVVLLLISLLTACSSGQLATTDKSQKSANPAKAVKNYSQLPLSFEPNVGQADVQLKFHTRTTNYDVFLTNSQLMLVVQPPAENPCPAPEHCPAALPTPKPVTMLAMKWLNANPEPLIKTLDELPGKANYFIGNDPAKWRTDVPTFAQVQYQAIYLGIDALFHGNNGNLQYDFMVAPVTDSVGNVYVMDSGTINTTAGAYQSPTVSTNFVVKFNFAYTNPPPTFQTISPTSLNRGGADFTLSVNGQARTSLAELNSDSSLNADFTSTAYSTTYTYGVAPDGKILVAGTLAQQAYSEVQRFNGEPALIWQAGETSPKTFTLPIVDDGLVEGAETLTVSIDKIFGNGVAATNNSTILTIVDNPAIVVSPGILPTATLNTAFNQRFSAAGGSGTGYNFAVTSGTLPTGLSLSSGGVLSGTPGGNAGTFNFTITVSDNAGGSNNQPYSLLVSPPGAIEFASPTVTVNESAGVANFTVNRIGNADRPVSARVSLGATGNTASPADYVYQPGSLDTTFSSYFAGFTNIVRAMIIQNDGKIILAGSGLSYNNGPYRNLMRLNSDGSLDTSFTTSADSEVLVMVQQPDGKILIGGFFGQVNGQTRPRLARLNSDGTLDTTFNPIPNGLVFSIVLQPDGKILIGGEFQTVNGLARTYIARLNPDGSLDNDVNVGIDKKIRTIALQADGRIIIGGDFTQVAGQAHNYLARLNSDGTLDNNFNIAISGTLNTITVQPDDKILIGGYITQVAGQPRNYLARLNSDGTLDGGFNPVINATVSQISVQPDNKLLIYKYNVPPPAQDTLVRLNFDGTLDSSFNFASNGPVNSSIVQPDGKIIIAGNYISTINGQAQNIIGRINNDIFVNWAVGDTSPKTFSLPLVKDGLAENNETLTLTLAVLSAGTDLGTNKSTVLTIVDNPTIAIAPVTLSAGTVGTSYSQTLTASGGSGTGFSFAVTSGALPTGLLGNALHVAVDDDFNLYITDYTNNRVSKFLQRG